MWLSSWSVDNFQVSLTNIECLMLICFTFNVWKHAMFSASQYFHICKGHGEMTETFEI